MRRRAGHAASTISAGDAGARLAPARGLVLRLAVLDFEPGDLAADVDVVLGAEAKRRVERRGGDLDEVIRVHEAEEARAAVPAELALGAGLRLVGGELVLARHEGLRLLGRFDERHERGAAVLAAVGAVAVRHVGDGTFDAVADAAAHAGSLVTGLF